MAQKALKAAGVSGKGGNQRRSPLAPTGGGQSGLPLDEVSTKEMRGALRPRGGTADGDAALGTKGARGRTATTAMSAQHRITATLPGPSVPEAQKTLANGRLMSPVMGTRQLANFNDDQRILG